MRLELTPEQAAQIEPHMRTGTALLGRVMREPFTGSNAATCGALLLELGPVPESSLPALRDAIRAAATERPHKLRRKCDRVKP